MSWAAERAAIESHFNTGWNAGPFSSVPIQWENIKRPDGAVDYLIHRLTDSEGRPIEMVGTGPLFERFVGLVQVDVLVGVGTGSAQARLIADRAAEIYRRAIITTAQAGTIRFRTPSLRSMGQVGERYRLVIACPFQRDVRH